MLFGLSVAPLHSDLWDLRCMLHANTAAASQASLFDFECVVLLYPLKSHTHIHTHARSGVYLYILSALQLGLMAPYRVCVCVCVCVCFWVMVDILLACGVCWQCCVAAWLCSRSKAWSTPARDYKELPTCTHTQRCMLHAYGWGGRLEATLFKYCLAS